EKRLKVLLDQVLDRLFDSSRLPLEFVDFAGSHTKQLDVAHYCISERGTAAATSRQDTRAASRWSMISWARTSGGGRFSRSSRLSSFSQKMSRLALSRDMSVS